VVSVAGRDLVVIGASAGGIEALCDVVADLPDGLPAAVLVVVHLPATMPSALPRILSRSGPLAAVPAEPGMAIEPGRIYVGVPDHHLLVHDDTLVLSRSARQNRARPAVDALFRSAARWRGPRTIGMVLSGALDDGAVGLATIHDRGGLAVVQDPADAIFPDMPRAALTAVGADAVVAPAAQLGRQIADLVGKPVTGPIEPAGRDLILETDMAEHDRPVPGEQPGRPAGLGCPECTGGISIVGEGATTHYRCHVGHSYSPQTLLDAQREKIEGALWTAVSILEEQAVIHQHLAARAAVSGASITVGNQRAEADEALRAAETIRRTMHREAR
jgi:two-component system chemotaxis response regulator CheB